MFKKGDLCYLRIHKPAFVVTVEEYFESPFENYPEVRITENISHDDRQTKVLPARFLTKLTTKEIAEYALSRLSGDN